MTNQTTLERLKGDVIKQGDTASIFEYKLNANGQVLNGQATIQLINFENEKYEFEADVVDNKVSFRLRDVLPEGIYTLEIEHAGYVFPSDNRTTITINKNLADYAEDVIVLQKISDEIKKQLANHQADSIDLEELAQKLNVAPYDDSSLRAEISQILDEIERLKLSEGKTTSYDDSELRSLISALSERVNQPLVLTDEQKEELRGPIGPKGEQGPQGERGEKGDTGTVDIAVLANYATKEELKEAVEKVSPQTSTPQRRLPTSWALDRSDAKTYKVVFDNGVVMYRKGDRSADTTGYGEYNFPIIYRGVMVAMLPYQAIWLSNGSMTLKEYKSKANGQVYAWREDVIIENPVNDVSAFDFEKASLGLDDISNPENARQSIAIKNLFAIGALSEREILELGALRKQ